jgi:hypothetical protein
MASDRPDGAFFDDSLSTMGAIATRNPSAFAWIQPARSTTSTGAVWSAATRPVNSRTRPVDRLAPSRSSVTTASASSRVTVGPSPASRDPTRTARSQSTMEAALSAVMSRR